MVTLKAIDIDTLTKDDICACCGKLILAKILIENIFMKDHKKLCKIHTIRLQNKDKYICDACIKDLKEDLEKIKEPERDTTQGAIKLADMNLSGRIVNSLAMKRIYTLGDLMKLSYSELLNVRSLGKKSVDEIFKKVYNK